MRAQKLPDSFRAAAVGADNGAGQACFVYGMHVQVGGGTRAAAFCRPSVVQQKRLKSLLPVALAMQHSINTIVAVADTASFACTHTHTPASLLQHGLDCRNDFAHTKSVGAHNVLQHTLLSLGHAHCIGLSIAATA